MKRNGFVTVVVGLSVALASTFALAGDWALLGEKILNYRSPEETLAVKDSGAFKSIKLQVKGSPLELKAAVVTFKDGTTFETSLNTFLAPGASTKPIDLPAAKVIEKVTVTYKKPGSTEKLATIRLLATS